MTLRRSLRPLRPDLDKFLFATVGDEIDGIPLSVISVLARLGLDAWAEADRLSSLSTREAVEQLASTPSGQGPIRLVYGCKATSLSKSGGTS
jgi:hypothetical protein